MLKNNITDVQLCSWTFSLVFTCPNKRKYTPLLILHKIIKNQKRNSIKIVHEKIFKNKILKNICHRAFCLATNERKLSNLPFWFCSRVQSAGWKWKWKLSFSWICLKVKTDLDFFPDQYCCPKVAPKSHRRVIKNASKMPFLCHFSKEVPNFIPLSFLNN